MGKSGIGLAQIVAEIKNNAHNSAAQNKHMAEENTTNFNLLSNEFEYEGVRISSVLNEIILELQSILEKDNDLNDSFMNSQKIVTSYPRFFPRSYCFNLMFPLDITELGRDKFTFELKCGIDYSSENKRPVLFGYTRQAGIWTFKLDSSSARELPLLIDYEIQLLKENTKCDENDEYRSKIHNFEQYKSKISNPASIELPPLRKIVERLKEYSSEKIKSQYSENLDKIFSYIVENKCPPKCCNAEDKLCKPREFGINSQQK